MRAATLGLVFLSACLRTVVIGCPSGVFQADGTCGPTAETPSWGDYIVDLDIPSCPAGNTLIVNTTTSEMDAGTTIADESQAGALLSFPEAMFIANNRPGQDNIFFDPRVFPSSNPGEVVWPESLPTSVSDACLDARHRGVVVYTAPNSDWSLGANVLQVGITFLGYLGESNEYEAAATTQIAGCRYGASDSVTAVTVDSPWVNSHGLVGPGNVFARTWVGPRTGATIFDNYFNIDPRSTAPFADSSATLDGASSASTDVELRGNLFAAGTGVAWVRSLGGTATFSNNLFEGALLHAEGPVTVLANAFRNVDVGILLGILGVTTAFISQNTFENIATQPILYQVAPPFAPPTVLSAGPTVSGTCSGAGTGTVELFATRSDDAEIYLASATCVANSFSVAVSQSQLGSGTWFITATYSEAGATSELSEPVPLP